MNLEQLSKNKYVRAGAIAGGAYLLYTLVRKVLLPSTTVKAAKDDEKKFKAAGQKQSYTDGQYKIFADAIYSAGFDVMFGTDEDTIYSVMDKMNNDLDVSKLIQAFGTRRIEFSTRNDSLAGFLRSELDSSEMQKVNNILSGKNIKYRF